MGKVTLCLDKYLDVKPIVALIETEYFDVKLFYKAEDIRALKPKYSKYITSENINIIYSLIKVREKLVEEYFFKIIDWLCEDYAIDISDYAKYKVCEKTFYFTYEDLLMDIEKRGIHCKFDYNSLYLSEDKYTNIKSYVKSKY